ncbi:hypothetical protein GFS31_41850 (plasmid) [Leptolyngbya sp. BL0902]|nr:hypothetical protein GFS31_41850 [Leptolyngbya sp. BL0902]
MPNDYGFIETTTRGTTISQVWNDLRLSELHSIQSTQLQQRNHTLQN